MSKPIALVIGATGQQGGSVANALLGDYHVRTLTRDPEKAAAKALAARGVEVLKGDLDDAESVKAALAGAETVFLVTQFWEKFSKESEAAQGKAFVDAVAATPTVKKFVYSGLENVTRVTGGRITKVAHFDGKGEVVDYIRSKGVPCAVIMLSAYHENYLGFFLPRPNGDGTYTLTSADMGGKPFNSVSVAETGQFVKALLARYPEFVGKDTPLCSDDSTQEEACAALSRATGVTVKCNLVPYDVFASFGFPGAADIADMMRFYAEGPCDRPTRPALDLFPGASNLETWARAHKDALLAAWNKKA